MIMKKNRKLFPVLLMIVLVLSSFAACGGSQVEAPAEPAASTIPAEVQAVMDKTTGLATKYAEQLNGTWADEYEACLASGQGRDYPGYADLKATLDGFRIESGAFYVYMLTDMTAEDNYFEITVDGSEEPDDWMAQYETEGQFVVAQAGQPAAALSAWDNDVDQPAWSAFAPVYNTAGTVVGILGVDYPAPEILDFPEWNRDAETWNGMKVE
jgi:hypothetical protein